LVDKGKIFNLFSVPELSMTYCSIEEAWGSSFSTPPKNSSSPKETPYGNIVPENAREMDPQFTEVEFKEAKVYRKSGKPVFRKKPTRVPKKKKSFSRTMNRLPEHSGSKNRYVSGDNIKQLQFNDDNQKVFAEDSLPSYDNNDVPITEYDKDLESNELSVSGTNYHEFTTKRPDSPFVSEMDESDSENYVPDIIEEESIYPSEDESDDEQGYDKQPRNHKERFQQPLVPEQSTEHNYESTTSLRENTVDVALYVITGMFLIFILDTFVKLGRRRH
jgi:hypothetical protein